MTLWFKLQYHLNVKFNFKLPLGVNLKLTKCSFRKLQIHYLFFLSQLTPGITENLCILSAFVNFSLYHFHRFLKLSKSRHVYCCQRGDFSGNFLISGNFAGNSEFAQMSTKTPSFRKFRPHLITSLCCESVT